ncbi:MAG: ABC transporter ATP-binding protein [Candidatus Omnitrophica bacterium]|nr:ABC transporter ATP-binding protein [Candidatus Omnitrophota bacterium]
MVSEPIVIENLTVRYGKSVALDGLSLKVREGEIFGFLGPNGAGKTTTIKVLLGLVYGESGTVRVHGLSPTDCGARRRIGYLPEEAAYYRFLTPLEILRFYGALFRIPRRVLNDRIADLLRLVGLAEVARRPLATFSKGMVQKVGLAQALVNDPDTLILDEPTSGLDPLSRMELRRLLLDLKSRGKTLFVSSHELSEIELICDEVAIIRSGRMVRTGRLKDIMGSASGVSLERFFIETVSGGAS